MFYRLANFFTQPLSLIGLLWTLLWVLPWVNWLDSLPWLRLGLAIFGFVVPGFFASLLLTGNRLDVLSHFISGLAISIFLVGLLGVLGRIAHFPFGYVKLAFVVTGLIVLATFAFHTRSGQQFFKPKHFLIKTLVSLFVIILFGALVALWDRIGLDERVYLTYVTSWQHSPRLDFKEVFFNSGNLVGARFWLAMFPMNMAFLSEVSGLHGLLLLGFYLGPIFVAIAILSAYVLYDDLLGSEQQTIAALALQVTLLFLLLKLRQPGNMFFFRITEDKSFAAFILAPVFFLAIRVLLESRTFRNAIFVVLTGWSLALTHPIILTYAVFIAGIYAIIITFTERDIKRLIVTITILLAIILPVASLRFVGSPWVSRYIFGLSTPVNQPGDFDLESALVKSSVKSRISYIKGTPFYGFKLSLVRIQVGAQDNQSLVFLSWSYLWILGLGFLWSLFNFKRHPVAPFIVATSLLVLLCAIPYTGWIIGKFVTARMLWRAPWLLPTGLSAVVLLDEFFNLLGRRIAATAKIPSRHVTFGMVLMLCSILAIYHSASTYAGKWRLIKELPQYKSSLLYFSDIGEQLEAHVKQPSRFAASLELMDYLPGLSPNSKVVFFRNEKRSPNPPNMNQVRIILSSDEEVSFDHRVSIFVRYDIQYIMTDNVSVKDYYNEYLDSFYIQEISDLWLIEFRGTSR
jgi:hypothetical protein